MLIVMSDIQDKRQTKRFPIRIPISLVFGEQSMDILTHNVSRSGIFLRAGLMPKIGKEMALECRVPTNREPVRLTAKVVHRTPPSNLLGQVTGFAVEILEGDLEAWASFLSLIELAEAQLRMESQLQEVDTEGLKLRRRPRVSRAMRIRLNVGDDQVSAVTEDVSGGGLFVRTDASFRVGQVMDVDVVHPQTFANIRCRAAVRWVGSKQGKNGIGLELIADDIEEARLGAFLSTGQFPALPPEEQS